MTIRTNILSALLATSSALLACAGCAAQTDAIEDSEVDSASLPSIETWVHRGWFSRTIYAKGLDLPGATYEVHIASRDHDGDCNPMMVRVMDLDEDPSPEVCVALGLSQEAISIHAGRCVDSAEQELPIYRYRLNRLKEILNVKDIDYEVLATVGGEIVGSSGWVPSESNGCPRD